MAGSNSSKHAVLYARFSPRVDEENCESSAIQLAHCRDYCNRKGYIWTAERSFFDNGYSGADPNRPGIWAAIAALKKGRGDVLVCRWFSRIARNAYLSCLFEKLVIDKGASMEEVEGGTSIHAHMDPAEKLMATIIRGFNEYEREIIGIRTSVGMKRNQRNGIRQGHKNNLPFGWQIDPSNDKRMIPHEGERQAMSIASQMKLLRFGEAEIAKRLTQLEIPCRPGGWTRARVWTMLNRMRKDLYLNIADNVPFKRPAMPPDLAIKMPEPQSLSEPVQESASA